MEKYLFIENKTIAESVENVSRYIEQCMDDITRGWRSPIGKFYIGKTHLKKSKRAKEFSVTKPATWRIGSGVSQRFCDHVKQDHGKNGLIVVAAVTKESIPPSCLISQSITHQEEYALILEKRLIQKFRKKDPRLANRTQEPGKTNRERSKGYVVYITFTMDRESSLTG